MGSKPPPPKGPPPKGKVPQINNTDRFNLNSLRTDVTPDIEKAIAASKSNELSKFAVFITGGANGLGREIAKAFAKEGSKVAILDKDQPKGQELATELCKTHGKAAGMFFTCNLADPKSFEAAVKLARNQLGRWDILVNNVSCWVDSLENFDKSITLNFKSVVTGSLLAANTMGVKKGGIGGMVINVSDSLAFKRAHLMPIYAATKAAVITFTTDMGLTQAQTMNKVGFISVVPNAFKGSRMFDEPHNKVFLPGREMVEPFNTNYNPKYIKQTPEHVAKNIVSIVKSGARDGIFLIEDGEDFKKAEMPSVSVKHWLPDK